MEYLPIYLHLPRGIQSNDRQDTIYWELQARARAVDNQFYIWHSAAQRGIWQPLIMHGGTGAVQLTRSLTPIH